MTDLSPQCARKQTSARATFGLFKEVELNRGTPRVISRDPKPFIHKPWPHWLRVAQHAHCERPSPMSQPGDGFLHLDWPQTVHKLLSRARRLALSSDFVCAVLS
jgi:hypothetical protein